MTAQRPAAGSAQALRTAAGPDVTELALAQIAESTDEWEAHPGEALVQQDHVSRQGFVVLSGSATVFINGAPIGRLGPGSAVWPPEDAGQPMPIDVVADQHMWLLILAPSHQRLLRR